MAFNSPYPHLTPAFVGREREMASALGFYEKHGLTGGMLLVESARGSGKSRFVEELLSKINDVDEDVIVWRASGKGVKRHPLHPFKAILPWEEMIDEVIAHHPPSVLPDYDERYLVFNAMAKKLREMVQHNTTILVVENLQLCDEMSLYLLHYTMRSHVPLIIIATLSPEDVHPKDAIGQTLGLMSRERLFTRILLENLGKIDLEKMVSNMLGHRPPRTVIGKVWDSSEGNPFITVQLIQSLIANGQLVFKESTWEFAGNERDIVFPKSVDVLIKQRLSSLSTEERDILDVCAILGPMISFPVLVRMADKAEDDVIDIIESLIDKGALISVDIEEGIWGDEEYSFPTYLLFRKTYESIPGGTRGNLHIQAAEILDEYSMSEGVSREDFMPMIAKHYFLGGQWGRSLPLFLGAGKRAESLSAFIDARDLYVEATILMEGATGAPPEMYVRTLLDAARMALITGETPTVKRCLERAIESAKENGLRKMEIEGRIYEGEIELENENFPEAERICLTTLQDAVLMGNIEHIGWCFERLGQVYWRMGKLKQAREFLENGLSYTQTSGDKLVVAKISTDLGNVWLSSGKPEKAIELYNRSMKILEDKTNKYEEARVYNNMGFCYLRMEKLKKAEEMYSRAIEISNSIGALKIYGLSNQGQAELWLERGNLDVAESFVFKAMDVAEMIGRKSQTIRCYRTKGIIASLRGDNKTARDLLEEAVDMAEDIGAAQEKGETLLSLGLFYKKIGEEEMAFEILRRAEKVFHLMGNDAMVGKVSRAMEWGIAG